MSDLKEIKTNPPEVSCDWMPTHVCKPQVQGVSASPISDNNLMVWTASIMGPDDTPWEGTYEIGSALGKMAYAWPGGVYSLRMVFTEDYPSKPPREVRFTTEMFHPNIYSDGSLCLDIIQDKWSPTYTVSSLLTSIQVRVTVSIPCLVPSNVLPHYSPS